MKKINDGGPAFCCVDGGANYLQEGMSLRDYFAAKAMQGLVSAHNQEGIWTGCGDETSNSSNRIMSETAYAIADAMIEARLK
jgi:hypothetical protein